MTAIEDETGDSANGKKRKEVVRSKRNEGNLDNEPMSLVLNYISACIPADS